MRFYKILQAKQCENAEGLTAYERQFVEYLKKIDIKTITGVLPLTFTAKGGNVSDWVIYGNDEPGENLVDENNFSIIQTDTNIYHMAYSVGKISAGYYTLTFNKTSDATLYITFRTGANYISYIADPPYTFDVPATVDEVIVRTSKSQMTPFSELGISNIMLVHGSIAPDHYIPYQQGVGERTKNLLNIGVTSGTVNNVTFTVDKNTGIIIANSNGAASATTTVSWQKDFSAGTYIFSAQLNGANDTYRMDVSKTDWTFVAVNYTGENTITLAEDTQLRFRVVIFSDYIADNVVFKPMLRLHDTTPDFIPYGYLIPLAVSQTGQTNKNYDIYIGDSPLTEGETISKTSTGQDIELFNGENTVSTTLYNKPPMEIKYK